MSPEVMIWEKDLDSKIEQDEKKWLEKKEDKDNNDKQSLEYLNKTWEKVYESALKTSPEAKDKLLKVKWEFLDSIKKIEQEYWDNWGEEKDKKIEGVTREYIARMTEIVWTIEASESEQSKKFNESLAKQQKSYNELLDSFLEKMKHRLSQEEQKELKKWLDAWREARDKWTKESEESKREAEKKLTEALWEWWKK